MDVSVVVCTYNRAALLRAALASLMELRTADRFQYEIVVVDNGSTDETSRVIQEAAASAPVPLRGVREPQPGVACARNCGVRAARGAWIAFFDDDQIAEPGWLLELMEAARQTGARLIGGAVQLLLPESQIQRLPYICRRLLGESTLEGRPRRFGRKLFAGTANLLVNRTIFDEIGLFDETLKEAGEDTDLNRRMRAAGIEGCFAPSAVVRHVVPRYRLGEDYFRWTSLRNGMHLARRERHQWGRALFPAVLAARLAQAAVQFVPRRLWGSLTGSPAARLEGRCQFWRVEGYLRLVLSWVTPARLAPHGFLSQLSFRTERELFVQGSRSHDPQECAT
jgi:glycosyltransferase involved in cell wall biosynthesis